MVALGLHLGIGLHLVVGERESSVLGLVRSVWVWARGGFNFNWRVSIW